MRAARDSGFRFRQRRMHGPAVTASWTRCREPVPGPANRTRDGLKGRVSGAGRGAGLRASEGAEREVWGAGRELWGGRPVRRPCAET